MESVSAFFGTVPGSTHHRIGQSAEHYGQTVYCTGTAVIDHIITRIRRAVVQLWGRRVA